MMRLPTVFRQPIIGIARVFLPNKAKLIVNDILKLEGFQAWPEERAGRSLPALARQAADPAAVV